MKRGGEDTLDHEGGENHHYAFFHNERERERESKEEEDEE